jgi:hypothetical protein
MGKAGATECIERDQPFDIVIDGGAWETCANWDNALTPEHHCPLDCSTATVADGGSGPTTLVSFDSVADLILDETAVLELEDTAHLVLDSEPVDCCAGLPGNYEQTADMCHGIAG